MYSFLTIQYILKLCKQFIDREMSHNARKYCVLKGVFVCVCLQPGVQHHAPIRGFVENAPWKHRLKNTVFHSSENKPH